MPIQTNILEYLEATAPRLPDKIAFSNGKESVCFRELSEGAKRLGSGLLAHVAAGSAVAILMEKHPRVPVAFFGTVYAGCFYVPLDPAMPASRMEMILEQVNAAALIVDEKGAETAKTLHFRGKSLSYAELVESDLNGSALARVRSAQLDVDPIYVVFTSGSTGVPKGVVACHRSVIDYTEALCDALVFSEASVFANQTPLYFDAPLKELMPVIKLGATTYFTPSTYFSFPMLLCRFLNEHRINTVCWVVTALTFLSSTGALEKCPPQYLTTVAFGSEVFPPAQLRIWRRALPNAAFYNLYGPTEATGMSCFWKADRELEEDEPIPIGGPFRNTGLLLIDENGKEAKEGEQGEIYLRGTCVTLGYFGDAGRTREAFVQNPLHDRYPDVVYRTGDLARRNRHGELVFVSRRDSQIKHNGYRIELGEIEAAAARHERIGRACCFYDAERRRIVLFYVGDVAVEELLSFLRTRLQSYMLPTNCVNLPVLPLTPNGKIDRRMLRERVERGDYA